MSNLSLFNLAEKEKTKLPEVKCSKQIKTEIMLLKSLWDDKPRIEDKNSKNKNLFIPKVRKTSQKLIVPKITNGTFISNLNNYEWKYNVNGSFISALGIIWIERYPVKYTIIKKKSEKEYNSQNNNDENKTWFKKVNEIREKWEGWGQTPFLDFKEGDSLDSRCKTISLQVEEALPVTWNEQKEKMVEGFVRYKTYKVTNEKYDVVDIDTCTQMEFLEKLIYGEYGGKNNGQN